MKINFALSGIVKHNRLFSICGSIASARFIVIAICLIVLSSQPSLATKFYTIKENASASDTQGYNITTVCLEIPGIGGTEIPVLLYQESVYLPVTALFDFLRLKNVPSENLDSIGGFIINEQDIYKIDNTKQHIYYHNKIVVLNSDDLIRTEQELFLKINYFNEVFGLECKFVFRNLSLSIKTMPDLPITRAIRRTAIQKELKYLKGEIKADTIIKPEHSFFNLGTADWSIVNMLQERMPNDIRANLNLGMVLAGGATNIGINYFNNSAFNFKQQYFLWRYAANNYKMFRQVSVGRIAHKATASIYDPVIGIQFSNAPIIPRQSFGSYQLADVTTPGWMVELYINNVLADCVKADPDGHFSFNIPMTFGSSVVKLRFYGLYGEEYSRVKTIYIPFSFLPKNEFEYTASAALVEDNNHSRFSKVSTAYGLTRHITIGGGGEYLSAISSGAFMPFVNTAIGASTHLLFSAEYIHGVRTKGIINYRLPANAWFELNYTRYSKDQKAILYNYLEDRKMTLFFPFSIGSFNGISRLSLNQAILPGGVKYTTGEWSISSNVSFLHFNLSTFTSSLGKPVSEHVYPNAYYYSNASLTFKLRKGFMFTTQGQYAYTNNDLVSVRCAVEKTLGNNGIINLSYEQNLKSNINGLSVGLRYDFDVARLGVTARKYNNNVSVIQSAKGSIVFDSKTHYLGLNNRTSVGRAGITFIPYLDLNGNGKKDSNEFKVNGLNVKMNGGRIFNNQNDTLIQVFDLNPYIQYNIDLSQNNFEDITLQVLHKTLSISILPNQIQILEIPIIRKCDVSGTISLTNKSKSKDNLHLKIHFYNKDGDLAGSTYTEADGTYYYPELLPGSYTIQIDRIQLEQLNLKASPESLSIKINSTSENNNFNFALEENLQTKATP